MVRRAGPGPTATRCCRRRSGPGSASRPASARAGATIVGDAGRIVSLEHFGASADYQRLYREFGITAEAVAAAAHDSIHDADTDARPGGHPADASPRRRRHRTDRPDRPPLHWSTTDEDGFTTMTSHDPLADLSAQGVAVWLDDLSRELLAGGDLQR